MWEQSAVFGAIDLTVDIRTCRGKDKKIESAENTVNKYNTMTVKIEEIGIGHRKRKYHNSFPNVLRVSKEESSKPKHKKISVSTQYQSQSSI